VKSAKSIAVGPGKWLTLLQAQALPNAPDITTTKRLRDRAIIAVLLGCVPRRSAVAALPDGRCSVGFTPEATVAARPANAPACRYGDRTFSSDRTCGPVLTNEANK